MPVETEQTKNHHRLATEQHHHQHHDQHHRHQHQIPEICRGIRHRSDRGDHETRNESRSQRQTEDLTFP